jgi:hypothetical protein
MARYEEIRNQYDSGWERTRLMTEAFQQMRELAPRLDPGEMRRRLKDTRNAARLSAYAFFHREPDFGVLEDLVQSAASSENKPFETYWGILAIGQIIAQRGERQIPQTVKESLQRFLRRLQPGTDRHYELGRILSAI